MPYELVIRNPASGEWEYVAGGGGGAVPPKEFQYGVDKPGAANTGVEPGVTLGDWDGPNSLTAAGTFVEGAKFPNTFSLAAANLSFKNCEFVGTPGMYGGTNTGGVVRATNVNVRGAQFENCTIRPAGQSSASIGIVGHDFEMYRCNISDTVDAIRLYNSADPNGPLNVKIHGVYAHDLAYYTPFAGHSDNQTHSDVVQIEGGTGIDIFGNFFSARASSVNGTGPATTQYPPYVLSCIMGTPNVGRIDYLKIRKNWFDGGYAPLNITEKGRGAIIGLEITDNRFSGQKGITQDILMEMTTRVANNNGAGWTGNIREDTLGQPVYGYG